MEDGRFFNKGYCSWEGEVTYLKIAIILDLGNHICKKNHISLTVYKILNRRRQKLKNNIMKYFYSTRSGLMLFLV